MYPSKDWIFKVLGGFGETESEETPKEPMPVKIEDSSKQQHPLEEKITHIVYGQKSVHYCPSCRRRVNRKTVDEIYIIEGPLYIRKDVGEGNFKALIKITFAYKCATCGYTKNVKSMMLPVESLNLLKPILKEEIVEVFERIRDKSAVIENIFKTYTV